LPQTTPNIPAVWLWLVTTCFWPGTALHTLVLSPRNQAELHVRDLIISNTPLSDCSSQFATAGSHSPIPSFDSAPKSLHKLLSSSQRCAQLCIPPLPKHSEVRLVPSGELPKHQHSTQFAALN